MTQFTLAVPIPSVARLTDVCVGLGTSQNKQIFKDASNRAHILCSVGGIEQNTHSMTRKCLLHYVNTYTNAHALVEGGWGAGMRHSVYDITTNKLFGWADYAQPGCFVEFDVATMACTFIKYSAYWGEGTDGEVWGSGFDICLGKDGKIYGVPQWWHTGAGWHCYQYDPAVGAASWTDLGRIMAELDDASTISIGASTTHVFAAVRRSSDGLRYLYSRPVGAGSWSLVNFGDATGSDALSISMSDAQDYYITRHRVGDDASTYLYYYFNAGGVTAVSPQPSTGSNPILNKAHCQEWMDDNAGYHSAAVTYFGTDFDFDRSIPVKDAQESSIIGYGNPATTLSEIAYTGSYYAFPISAIVPTAGRNFHAFPSYARPALFNYSTGLSTGKLTPGMSAYGALFVPASHSPLSIDEIYYCGYPKSVKRLNPAAGWTSYLRADYNSANNPYNLTLPAVSLNYILSMEYDYNGIIWIGGNHYNWGNIFYYNPTTNISYELFPTWEASSIVYISLCHALNRTKIVVSASNGYIYVIDAATKTVDGSYNIGVPVFLIEVANDVIICTDYTNNKVGRFKPSDRTMLTALTATGLALAHFGFDASSGNARRRCKLELGPDGYAWMFMGASIYRIHPDTGVFSKVVDKAANASPRENTYGMIKFSADSKDLLIYYGDERDWDMEYYLDIFTVDVELKNKSINGAIARKVSGAFAEKVNGVQM